MQANTIRVSFWLKLLGDTDEANPWIITQHLKPVSGPMSTATFDSEFRLSPPASLYALWHNALTTSPGTGGFRGACPSSTHWYHTEISARLAMTPGDSDHVAVFTPSTPIAGARAGTVAPQPLAVVAQKIPLTGTRRQWGRNYLPCVTTNVDTDGRTIVAQTASIKTALDVVWSASWVRSSLLTPVVHNGDGFSRAVDHTGIGTYVGVQRRRLR